MADQIPSSGFARDKLAVGGCSFLTVGLLCAAVLPFSSLLATVFGISAGSSTASPADGQTVNILALISVITVTLNIGVTIVAVLAGILMLGAWGIKQFSK